MSCKGKVLSDRYVIKKQIAKGGFSRVYVGEDMRTGRKVAIKVEDSSRASNSYLRYEYEVLKVLRGGFGIPDVYFYHEDEDGEKMLVMEYLGPSISSVLSKSKRFSLKTVLMLVEQMLSCLEYIHNKGFVHRDIKPGNFLIGTGNKSNRIFLVDFGLSRRIRDESSTDFNRSCIISAFEGTTNFASTAAHDGFDQCPKDELEGLMYALVHMLKGHLPWSDCPFENGEAKNKLIGQRKKEVTAWELCDGLPSEFRHFFTSVKSLGPFDRPDYSQYREMFRRLFISKGFIYDYNFDWREITPEPQPAEVPPSDNKGQLVKPMPSWMRKHGNK